MDDQLITDLMRRERKRREALWQLSSPLKQEQAIQDLLEIERLDMTLPPRRSRWLDSRAGR